MARYLLDTTVLIDHLRGRQEVVDLLSSLAEEGHEVGVCAVNVAELYAGLNSNDRFHGQRLISGLDFFVTTAAASQEAGAFRHDFARQGIALSVAGALIAATAIEVGAILVTANVKDFPMTALRVEPQP